MAEITSVLGSAQAVHHPWDGNTYLQGTVAVTGGTGLKAKIVEG